MSSLLPQYCQLDTEEGKSGCKWTRYGRRTALVNSSTTDKTNNGNIRSAPGEFHASLATDIDISVASTDHAAIFHFDYSKAIQRGSWPPTKRVNQRQQQQDRESSEVQEEHTKRANNLEPVLVFDYTTDLQNSGRSPPNRLDISSFTVPPSKDVAAAIAVTRIQSVATFAPSFGVGTFQVYTCVDVPFVKSSGVYQDSNSVPGITGLTNVSGEAGVILTLDQDGISSAPYNGVLPVRMGISWTSTDAACRYASSEIPTFPSPTALSTTAVSTRQRWNDLLSETLSISHQGVTPDDLKLFYSSLYRSFLSPNNVTGDNPRFATNKPSYDSLYCIWDSARTIHPLWALLAPRAQGEVIEAIVEIQKHEGWLPDCRMSTNQGFTQGGSNAEMMLSDSYVKSILADDKSFWESALQAMLKDARVEPPSWGLVGQVVLQPELNSVTYLAEIGVRLPPLLRCRVERLPEP